MAKTYRVGLVGESNYQDAIRSLEVGERVYLEPEPDNPHDPRAIAARDANGAPIGYIARDSWLTAALIDQDKGSIAKVESIEGGDEDRPSLGVVLSVELGAKGETVGSGPEAKSSPIPGMASSPKQVLGCGIVAIIALLALPAMCSGDTSAPEVTAEDTVTMPSDEALSGTISPDVAEPDVAAPVGNGLTGAQANARRSAEDYIRMSGFSRAGLIDQLSSEYGSGYDLADATAAVDSLDVDWNEQAARSASDYVRMSGFSCSGLVEQLSSDYGSKYTRSEAEYGARQAGAC